MKNKRVLISLGALTLMYLSVLVWVDSKSDIFIFVPKIVSIFPVLLLFSALSYLLRYIRWQWLLWRAGFQVSAGVGLLVYISGFAFTATPGKVGELIRIRYYQHLGVPHNSVISAFIFERTFDLIVVLSIASLAASQFDFFYTVVLFVFLIILILFILIRSPHLLICVVAHLRIRRFNRSAKIFRVISKGVVGVRIWYTPLDFAVAITCGLLAWSITSMAFVFLLSSVDIIIPFIIAVAIYPLSMLAGAVTMLPGGVGGTEAATVAMLSLYDVNIEMALFVAISIRIVSLWFAIICGFLAMMALEYKLRNI